MCDQAQLLVNSYSNKSDNFEGCDIDTCRDNTFVTVGDPQANAALHNITHILIIK